MVVFIYQLVTAFLDVHILAHTHTHTLTHTHTHSHKPTHVQGGNANTKTTKL